MIAVLLGLTSAVSYGVSDFAAGIAARRATAWAVAVCTQFASLIVIAIALLVPALRGAPTGADLAWGLLAAVGNALGTAFLYRGFATGRLSVVAPISAVGVAVVPVVAGLALGERPSALVWAGILAALPGIWCVSRVEDQTRGGTVSAQSHAAAVRYAMVAGFGFGVLLVALARIPREAGLGPIVFSQVVTLALVVAMASAVGGRWRPTPVAVRGGGAAGALSGAANLSYLWATHSGPMTVAAILVSLYPAVTILLAAGLLREHVDRVQGLGLTLCGAAVALVASG